MNTTVEIANEIGIDNFYYIYKSNTCEEMTNQIVEDYESIL